MKKAMEALGALQWFDAAIASCEIGAIKPAHQMYEAILAALGVPARRFLWTICP